MAVSAKTHIGMLALAGTQATTLFSTGGSVATKFRGRDTLSRSSTTRLNTSSGTGDQPAN